jgi:hypothetical protein
MVRRADVKWPGFFGIAIATVLDGVVYFNPVLEEQRE